MITTFDRLSVGERFLFCGCPHGCCRKLADDLWCSATDAGALGIADPTELVVSVDAPTPSRRMLCAIHS